MSCRYTPSKKPMSLFHTSPLKVWKCCSEVSSESLGWIISTFLAFLHSRSAPASWPSLLPSSWPVPTVSCLSCTFLYIQSWMQLEVGPHQSGGRKKPPLSQRAGHISFDTDQDTVGFPGCKCIMPIHSEFFVYQYPQVLLHRTALNPFTSSLCWCWGLPQPRWGTLVLAMLNFMGPLLKAAKSRSSDSVGPDNIFYVFFLIFCYACHLYSYWLVAEMVQKWKQAMCYW